MTTRDPNDTTAPPGDTGQDAGTSEAARGAADRLGRKLEQARQRVGRRPPGS